MGRFTWWVVILVIVVLAIAFRRKIVQIFTGPSHKPPIVLSGGSITVKTINTAGNWFCPAQTCYAPVTGDITYVTTTGFQPNLTKSPLADRWVITATASYADDPKYQGTIVMQYTSHSDCTTNPNAQHCISIEFHEGYGPPHDADSSYDGKSFCDHQKFACTSVDHVRKFHLATVQIDENPVQTCTRPANDKNACQVVLDDQ